MKKMGDESVKRAATRGDAAERHAIVLSGGGANGAYALGVMEALFGGEWCRGRGAVVEASIFTGTSVGAYTAAIMASLFEISCLDAVRLIRRLWLDEIAEKSSGRNGVYRVRGDIRPLWSGLATRDFPLLRNSAKDLFSWSRDLLWRGADLTFSEDTLVQKFLGLFNMENALSTGPLKRLIARTVDVRRLLDPRARAVSVITTNWDVRRPVIFHNRPNENLELSLNEYEYRRFTAESVPLALQASTAIPGLISAVKIGEDYFVDGGVLMNAPLYPAIDAGGTVLHVIQLSPKPQPLAVGQSSSMMDVLEGMVVTTPDNQLRADLRLAARRKDAAAAARAVRRLLDDNAELAFREDSRDQEHIDTFLKRYADKPPITIHNYSPGNHPRDKLLGGIGGFLDFRRERLVDLIKDGYSAAVEHDCEENGCIL